MCTDVCMYVCINIYVRLPMTANVCRRGMLKTSGWWTASTEIDKTLWAPMTIHENERQQQQQQQQRQRYETILLKPKICFFYDSIVVVM